MFRRMCMASSSLSVLNFRSHRHAEVYQRYHQDPESRTGSNAGPKLHPGCATSQACQAIARAQTVASHCSAERTTDVEKRPILISSFFQPRPEHEVETAEAL